DADPLRPRQVAVEDEDADDRGAYGERELSDRGEQCRGSQEAVVVKVKRKEAGDEGQHCNPEAVVEVRVRGGADDRERDGTCDEAEPEADGRAVLEGELAAEVAAEDGAQPPEHRGG